MIINVEHRLRANVMILEHFRAAQIGRQARVGLRDRTSERGVRRARRQLIQLYDAHDLLEDLIDYLAARVLYNHFNDDIWEDEQSHVHIEPDYELELGENFELFIGLLAGLGNFIRIVN